MESNLGSKTLSFGENWNPEISKVRKTLYRRQCACGALLQVHSGNYQQMPLQYSCSIRKTFDNDERQQWKQCWHLVNTRLECKMRYGTLHRRVPGFFDLPRFNCIPLDQFFRKLHFFWEGQLDKIFQNWSVVIVVNVVTRRIFCQISEASSENLNFTFDFFQK